VSQEIRVFFLFDFFELAANLAVHHMNGNEEAKKRNQAWGAGEQRLTEK